MKEDGKALLLTRQVQQDRLSTVIEYLSDLDLLAGAILHYNYKGNPNYINYHTIACIIIDDELWYAANHNDPPSPSQVVDSYNRIKAPNMKTITDAYYIHLEPEEGDDKHTHAEMKLLYQLVSEDKLVDNIQIGISKPACSLCYNTLLYNNFKISWTHPRQVTNWARPEVDDDYLPEAYR